MTGSGGWPLHVVCVVCRDERIYKAVVLSLAVEAAERDGWVVDREALYESAYDRYAACPRHAGGQGAT